MTTEDDFQKQLDACPEDWQTRLVFADWLEERGDARAEGYRALGRLRKRPRYYLSDELAIPPNVVEWLWHLRAEHSENELPYDWFSLLQGGSSQTWPKETQRPDGNARREAEDAAALAFAKLPPERRAELLTIVEAATT